MQATPVYLAVAYNRDVRNGVIRYPIHSAPALNDVRNAPKATELRRRHEMSRRGPGAAVTGVANYWFKMPDPGR